MEKTLPGGCLLPALPVAEVLPPAAADKALSQSPPGSGKTLSCTSREQERRTLERV